MDIDLLKNKKVLVFEDDIVISHLMLNLLSKVGLRVFMSQDGKEGIDIALEIMPDIILMDIEMPNQDGYETTRLIKSNPKLADIPVVFITSKSAEEDAGKAFQLGGVSFVKKPIDPNQLYNLISLVVQSVAENKA